MDPLTARVINEGDTSTILRWLTEFLRYTAKLSKYDSTQVLKFMKSILNKSQFLDQRQLLFSLFPYTRANTVLCVYNLVKLVQFTNNKELTSFELVNLSGISNQTIHKMLSKVDAQTCTFRLRGGDRGVLVVFGECNFQFEKNELISLPFVGKRMTDCQLHEFQSGNSV